MHRGPGPLAGWGCRWSRSHRRGHGALYNGIDCGRVGIACVRNLVAAQRLPRAADGCIVLAVDVSRWLRIPGWSYLIEAALETGGTSWTALLDAVRL